MGVRKSSEGNAKRMGTPAFIGSVILAGVVIITGAVFIGKSDTGPINVSASIQNANQANTESQGDQNNYVDNVPERFRSMPNGGLVPSGAPEVPPPPPQEEGTTTPAGEGATSTPNESGDGTTEENQVGSEGAVPADATNAEGESQNAEQQ